MENNQAQIIRTKVEELRRDSPWMEEYEIEAIVCTNLGIDSESTPEAYHYLETAIQETRAAKKAAGSSVEESLTKDYSMLKEDGSGKYGAYEAVNKGASQRRDLGTRALYDIKAADRPSAVLDKARATISTNIKREVNRIGFSLVASIIIEIAISMLLVFFSVVLMGNSLYQVYDFITTSRNMAFLHAGMLLVGLAFPFVIYLLLHKLSVKEMVPFHKLRKGEFAPMLCMGLGVMMLNGCFVNYVNQGGPVRGGSYDFDAVSFGTSVPEMLLTLVCLSIIPALIETFVFNGVILQVLRRRGSDNFALVFSSLLFALMTTNFIEMPGAFLTSLWLGYMVIFSGSLVPALAVRLVERLLFFGITQLGFALSDVQMVQYIDCAVTVIILLLAIFSVKTMLKRFPEMFSLKKGDPCLTLAEKVRMSVLRPSIIVLVAYSLFFSLLQVVSIDDILNYAEKFFYG